MAKSQCARSSPQGHASSSPATSSAAGARGRHVGTRALGERRSCCYPASGARQAQRGSHAGGREPGLKCRSCQSPRELHPAPGRLDPWGSCPQLHPPDLRQAPTCRYRLARPGSPGRSRLRRGPGRADASHVNQSERLSPELSAPWGRDWLCSAWRRGVSTWPAPRRHDCNTGNGHTPPALARLRRGRVGLGCLCPAQTQTRWDCEAVICAALAGSGCMRFWREQL